MIRKKNKTFWFKTGNLEGQPGKILSYIGEGFYEVFNTDKNKIHIVFELDFLD